MRSARDISHLTPQHHSLGVRALPAGVPPERCPRVWPLTSDMWPARWAVRPHHGGMRRCQTAKSHQIIPRTTLDAPHGERGPAALSPRLQSPTATLPSTKGHRPLGQAACSLWTRASRAGGCTSKYIYIKLYLYIHAQVNTNRKPPYGDPDNQSRANHKCPTPMNSSLGKHQARLENFATASPRKYPAGPEPSPSCSRALRRAVPCRRRLAASRPCLSSH